MERCAWVAGIGQENPIPAKNLLLRRWSVIIAEEGHMWGLAYMCLRADAFRVHGRLGIQPRREGIGDLGSDWLSLHLSILRVGS